MKNIFSKKEFKAWLDSKEPEAVVGKAKSAVNCPLARYLQNNKRRDAVVGVSDARFGGTSFTLNGWQRKFVFLADRLESGTLITADKAKKILNRVGDKK